MKFYSKIMKCLKEPHKMLKPWFTLGKSLHHFWMGPPQFSWCVLPTLLQGFVHVLALNVKKCETSRESKEMVPVIVVNVWARRPRQLHYPASRSWSSSRMTFVAATEQLEVWLMSSWTGAESSHQPSPHKNRWDSLSEERPSEWLKRI